MSRVHSAQAEQGRRKPDLVHLSKPAFPAQTPVLPMEQPCGKCPSDAHRHPLSLPNCCMVPQGGTTATWVKPRKGWVLQTTTIKDMT